MRLARSRKRSAVSTVLGAVILVAIVFTVLIPLLFFIQNTSLLYFLQVSERNRRELERIQENLEVHATVFTGNMKPYLLVVNRGVLAANITRIYMADSNDQLFVQDTTYAVPPVSPIKSFPLSFFPSLEYHKSYVFQVATERGRSYSAAEKPLSLSNPPYTLQVMVMNMKYDHIYEINVETSEMTVGSSTIKLGCIARVNSCDESSSLNYYASIWNENQTFFFKLLPGNYSVTVRELEWNGATWEEVNEYGPRSILILDNAVMVFRLPYNAPLSISDIQSAFTISIDAPSSVFTKMEGDSYKTVTVNIGVNIGLVAVANESLRDLKIKLEEVGKFNLDPDNPYDIYPCGDDECNYGVIELERLRPGENMTLNFRLELNPTDDLGGGYIILRASLEEAKGEMTGETYGPVYSDDVTISLCKFTEMTYIKCFYFRLMFPPVEWGDPNCKSACEAAGTECNWTGGDETGVCICSTDMFPRCSIP
ncbi:MAG: hypothetical protein J7J19_00930 [Thaumarchaeota archaeon]|nr:hypothetical protein [Nitrososphaerota archaeon]